MDCGIYSIRNTINGKVYIGSSVCIARRLRYHAHSLGAGIHFNCHLQNAWNKYGLDAFELGVLLYCDKKKLLFYEQRAINAYKTTGGGVYNLSPVAGSRLGVKMSSEAKRKISIGNKISMIGNKNPLGHRHTEESKQKMSNAKTGFKFSEISKSKMSESHKGKVPWNKGLTGIYSDETRIKMGADKKGKTYSEETKRKKSIAAKKQWESEAMRKKMSLAHKGKSPWMKGKHHSEEARRKISEALRVREISNETRQKLSIAAKNQWARCKASV